jgi:hypothetical protein
MDYLADALNLALTTEEAACEDCAAVLLEQGWPNNEIGGGELVLDGDEEDPLGRAWPLPHENETGCLKGLTVTGCEEV